MSTPIPYLSALVLLCSAFPTQLFRVVMVAAPDRARWLSALAPPALLSLLAGLVWYVAPTSGVLQAPSTWLWCAVAVVVGGSLPAVELGTGLLLAKLGRRRVAGIGLHERVSGGGWLTLVLVPVTIAVAEEVIFRGVALELLVGPLGWPAALAVAATAIGYGLNHTYFGWLTVAQKVVSGAGFGVLYLAAGGSLLVPAIAHAVQNLVVYVVLPRLRGRR
ncbi:MAG TPA: CPBP family intramembrane glutamic endopeptidase [Natronosporangium sp.]